MHLYDNIGDASSSLRGSTSSSFYVVVAVGWRCSAVTSGALPGASLPPGLPPSLLFRLLSAANPAEWSDAADG